MSCPGQTRWSVNLYKRYPLISHKGADFPDRSRSPWALVCWQASALLVPCYLWDPLANLTGYNLSGLAFRSLPLDIPWYMWLFTFASDDVKQPKFPPPFHMSWDLITQYTATPYWQPWTPDRLSGGSVKPVMNSRSQYRLSRKLDKEILAQRYCYFVSRFGSYLIELKRSANISIKIDTIHEFLREQRQNALDGSADPEVSFFYITWAKDSLG